MKKIVMMLVGMGAVSASAQVCNQSTIKEMSYFMSVYNANVGKCVVGPAGPACNAICEAVDSMPKELFTSQVQAPSAPPVRCPELPPAPPVIERCNQNELDRVYRSAQEDTIRRLKKDLMVEGRVSARGFAQNPDFCVKEAHRKASRDIRQAQLDCERQLTSGLSTRCDEAGMRIVQNPIKVMPYKGVGKYKEDRRGKTPEICKRDAQKIAAREAVEICQRETEMPCQLQREPTPATFREKEERRYGIAGPKDTYYICESEAEAMPINVGYVCAVEVYTRIDLD